MKKVIVGIILLFVLTLLLHLIGISVSILYSPVIEWATKFILPWILLYWIIRFIKNSENPH